MQQVNKLLTTKLSTSQTQAGQKDLSNADVENVNYVYARLKTIFAGKYKTTFPTEKAEIGSKLEWTNDITKFSKEELERGLEALKSSDIGWPDIKSFLNLCKPVKTDPAHKLFQLPAPRNIDRKAGHKNASSILDMLKK